LGALDAPTVLAGSIGELPTLLALRGEGEVRFDAVVGRGALAALPAAEWAKALAVARSLLAEGGRLSLAETVLRASPRPSSLLGPLGDEALAERLAAAEERAVAALAGPAADGADLAEAAALAGFAEVQLALVELPGSLTVTEGLLGRWLDGGPYAAALATALDPDEIAALRARFRALLGESHDWPTTVAFLTGGV
jgi:hypothetical protein